MVNLITQVPIPNAPMVMQKTGVPVKAWFDFFTAVWLRTGGPTADASVLLDSLGSTRGGMLARFATTWAEFEATIPNTVPVMNPSADVQLLTASQFFNLASGIASILDYGAVAGDPTKFAVNQAAIQAALATGRPTFAPDGQTFYTQAATIPANAHSLFGRATFVAAGPIGVSALLSGTALTNFAVSDLTIQIDAVAYPNLDGIDLSNCVDPTVENVKTNGFNGILTVACTRPQIRFCQITDYNNIGIVDRGSTDVEINTNRVTTSNLATSFYGIQASASDGVDISNNWVSNSFSFGIVVSGDDAGVHAPVKRITINGNRTLNTGLEGINLANVTGFAVTGNDCIWTNGSSRDFGISCFGDPNIAPVGTSQIGTISGNTVYQSGKAGIVLANNCQGVTVSGNTIYGANTLNGATVYHISGILFYGKGSLNNKAVGNNIIDPLARLTWGTNEFDDGVGAGAGPDFNSFTENSGAGSSGNANIVGANSSAGNKTPFYLNSQTGVGGAGATQFFVVGGSATELNVYGVAPATGTFRNLWLNLNTAPGGVQTDTFTLRVNGADTAITCVVTGAAVSGSDITHAVPVTKGQTWSIKIVGSAAAAATIVNGGIELDTY